MALEEHIRSPDAILIRRQEDGKSWKGAAAYDWHEYRDTETGEVKPGEGELPARPVKLEDVDGLISEANLATIEENTRLQAANRTLSDQVMTLESERAKEAEKHRQRIEAKDERIKELQSQIEEMAKPAIDRQIERAEADLAKLKKASRRPDQASDPGGRTA